MKVLLPASEVAPIIKLGGLGDVIGSLPIALEKLGVNIDVIVPYYSIAKVENLKVFKSMNINVPFSGENNVVEVYRTKLPGSDVDVFMLKNSRYFVNGGVSAFENSISETEMFAFFNRAVVEYIKAEFNTYDLIHCNDWHTGLLTHILSDELERTRPATLFTIHNLGYQGKGDVDLVRRTGFIPGSHSLLDWDISDGDLNLLQQGISSSDYINAVSPQYAKEILTDEFGGDLVDILRAREARITGILNGVNYLDFPRDYDLKNWQEVKARKKTVLRTKLNMENTDKPLFSFIGRIDPNQKGMDILYDVLPNIVDGGGQFVLLGTGDSEWEEKLTNLSNEKKYEKDISCNIMFDTELAREVYSGADFLMVPSRYEPCGLIQMIAMWYGTLPVAHATGGLKDSIIDGQTGILFDEYSSNALRESVNRCFSLYRKQEYANMIETAMKQDFSWDKSAVEYKELYEKVINIRKAQVQ